VPRGQFNEPYFHGDEAMKTFDEWYASSEYAQYNTGSWIPVREWMKVGWQAASEDAARECLTIAKNYAGSWCSPTADEIVTALERRVMEHAEINAEPHVGELAASGPGTEEAVQTRSSTCGAESTASSAPPFEDLTHPEWEPWTLEELLTDLESGDYLYLTPTMARDLATLLRKSIPNRQERGGK